MPLDLFDVYGLTPENLLPAGGTTGQTLVKKSAANGDVDWADVEALPAGGTATQVLTKRSGTDGDATWMDVPPPALTQHVHYGSTDPANTLGQDGDLYYKIP